MSLKIAAIVAGLALVGLAVSGCVETGPGYGAGYHHATVYAPAHRRYDSRHRRPSHEMHNRGAGGHHMAKTHHRESGHNMHGKKPKVDCRRHPRDRACRGRRH